MGFPFFGDVKKNNWAWIFRGKKETNEKKERLIKFLLHLSLSFRSSSMHLPSPPFLKNFPSQCAQILQVIFTQSYESGIPWEWKLATVSPVYKKDDKFSPKKLQANLLDMHIV